MGRRQFEQCTVCRSAHKHAVDRALVEGVTPSAIAERFGLWSGTANVRFYSCRSSYQIPR
jgi:hypothetical protein